MRHQGYSDEQLRQTLLQRGYAPEQVDSLLTPQNVPPATEKNGSNGALVLVFLILIVGAGVVAYFLLASPDKIKESGNKEEPSTGVLDEMSKTITNIDTGDDLVKITFRGRANDIAKLKRAKIIFWPTTEYDGNKVGGMISSLQPLTFEGTLEIEMQYTDAALALTRTTNPSFLEQDLAIGITDGKEITFLNTTYVKSEKKLTAQLDSFPSDTNTVITIMQESSPGLEDYQAETLTIDFCNGNTSADCITTVAAFNNDSTFCNQLTGTERDDCLQAVELLEQPVRVCELGSSGMLGPNIEKVFYQKCTALGCANNLKNIFTKCNSAWDTMCVTCVACYCGE